MSHNFIELDKALSLKNSLRAQSKSTILKKNQVRLSEKPLKLGEEKKASPQVEPILKDGQVEGVKVTCSCGEIIHVYFKYAPPAHQDGS